MTTINSISFTGKPIKSFEAFSEQFIKKIKRGQNSSSSEFTKSLSSFSDCFETNRDAMNKKSKKFAEALVGLKKDNLAGIVYSFLIKINHGNSRLVEDFATNALKIAIRTKDSFHIMARANDLREIYQVVPPETERFIKILYDEKHALNDIIKNYDKFQNEYKNLKPKENYQILLADVNFDIGKRHKDKNISKEAFLDAKSIYESFGLDEKAKRVEMYIKN